ncbi:hypothetical protein ACN28S_42925 [Cystobacter fuscus]
MMVRRWLFYVLLGVQWFVAFPMTLYASERFEDMYDVVEEGSEPVLMLSADPDAAIHFGLHLVMMVALSLLLVFLRSRREGAFRGSSVLLFIPLVVCLALRFWVGCITCRP